MKTEDSTTVASSGRAGATTLFPGFFIAGFEGSAHRRADGRQLDLIAATRHDENAALDYRLVREAGFACVRDALRWHLIDDGRGYDWSSFLPMLRAAREAGLRVIWDLCHYGVPDGVDIWSGDFPERFAAFCAGVARVVRSETDEAPVYCPVNEISYWSWLGGDTGRIYPHATDRGPELKRQLVRAAIAAMDAIRAVEPSARFVHVEPLINVVARKAGDGHAATASAAQFEAFDMIAGRSCPDLGGTESHLDILGLNFYYNNQWFDTGETIPLGHDAYTPLRELLAGVDDRYRRPMLLSETGAEHGNDSGWLAYVTHEARAARRRGAGVEAICLYPVMDYPGWNDDRHCRCGLLHADAQWRGRWLDQELLEDLRWLRWSARADVPRP